MVMWSLQIGLGSESNPQVHFPTLICSQVSVGEFVGIIDGRSDGECVGISDGFVDGKSVGCRVGPTVGRTVGPTEGFVQS